MNEQLQRLMALAQTDAALRLLGGRLGDLEAEEQRLRARFSQNEQELRARQEAHRKLRSEALAKMNEVDATEEKIRLYQHKLDHEIIPYKEMEYLREQVMLLRARMDPLADEALGLSEEVERDAERLREDEAKHKARQTALEEDLSSLEQRREALLREKETLLREREERSAQVAAHLRQHYERLLRSTHSPVVPVAGGTCGGCHLRLSESTLTRVKEEREVVTCENCSRFLYWRWR